MKINKAKLFISVLIFGIGTVSFFWYVSKNPISQIQKGQDGQKTVSKQTANNKEYPTENAFSFAIQADPHMDEQSDGTIYKQTLQNIVKDSPSFLIDLGDTFMVDKLTDKSEANIKSRFTLMKSYYDLLGSIPLYFVMGNHDGEAGWDSLNTKKYRSAYFPNQTLDKNYYSFEQNNSLFIMLDPYTYTMQKPNADGWGWTLGKEQYEWLKVTLEKSSAEHKFVFIHQLVGGDNQGRGGVEFANLYEWGGNNVDGSFGFDTKRAGWGKPIHQLLVDNKVKAVFKGHDHFFAKQDLDGIVYQTLPQPSHPGNKFDNAQKYGYLNGEILGGSGYLRVTTIESAIVVDFVRFDSEIVTSYTL